MQKEPKFINKLSISLLVIALFVTVIIDLSFVNINDLIYKSFIAVDLKINIFLLNSVICIFLQLYILSYILKFYNQERFMSLRRFFRHNFIICILSLLIMLSLILIGVIQMNHDNRFSTFLLILLIVISYGTSSFFLILLSILFYKWYRINNRTILLLYLVSITFILVNLVASVMLTVIKLSDEPSLVRPSFGATTYFVLSKYAMMDSFYEITSVLSFVSLWITSLILVINYRKKSLKNVLFIILLTLPLVNFGINYILMHFTDLVFVFGNQFSPVVISMLFVLYYSLGKPIGGIMFGFLFWRTSKSLGYERDLVGFILLSGFGIMLLFSTDQATLLVTTPYPPFGMSTITIMVLASYLMLNGLYNSAKLVSYNNQLRQSIINATRESRILNMIGEAEKQKELESILTKVHDSPILNDDASDVKPLEFDEEELKNYISEIVSELQSKNDYEV